MKTEQILSDINLIHFKPADLPGELLVEPPFMPQEEIWEFVQHHFSCRELYLQAFNKESSPIYLLDSSILRKKADEFKNAFINNLPETSFYYAVKSNNHPQVANTLLESGFGLDVSSGVELELALGLNATDIIFSGPGKTDQELTLAVEHADRVIILIDSFGELERLKKITESLDREIRAGIRLNNNPHGLWRKFGILPEELSAFWRKAREASNVKLEGIQFHSSWNLDPEKQISFIKKLGSIIQTLPDNFRSEISFIDIGGGYWPPQGEWLQEEGTEAGKIRGLLGYPKTFGKRYRLAATPIDNFAEKLAEAIQKHIFSRISCRICFEPGRWICNDAMHLIFSVVDKKMDDLVITDAGTNSVGWERYEVDYFPVLNLSRPALTEKPCQIVGSLCTPHDLWGDSYWGGDIQPGDILMIPTQGAYTYSLRQNFIKPLPKVVTL
ncbi:MAG: alanine racemase [Proteobacteria bacterium]|nr:alanine racemase [Pseudomonadota bacterium]MBU1716980.1 alanine racemase [Pseudomonadota bacterium]